jgi:serralysin
MKGLVWLGVKGGATTEFQNKVKPFIGNAKVFGFYLWDEPDPTGRYGALITPSSLREQSDWIHQNVPGAKTFIVLMNMGPSNARPDYMNTYNPANTGIDLYGLDPYPFRTDAAASNLNDIDAAVAAAVRAGNTCRKNCTCFSGVWRGYLQNGRGPKICRPYPETTSGVDRSMDYPHSIPGV